MTEEVKQRLLQTLNTRECIHATLARSAHSYPQRIALEFGHTTYTYERLWEDVRILAKGLRANGVMPGDKVAIMLPNSYEFVLAVYALSCLGAIEVPVNTRYKKAMLLHVLQDSGSRTALVHNSYIDDFSDLYKAGNELALDNIFVVGKSNITKSLTPGQHTKSAFYKLTRPYGDLLADVGMNEDDLHHGRYFDVHAVLYTSGTTGPSKGVLVSHSHTLTYARDWIRAVDFTTEDVIYSPLPLFHTIAHSLGLIPSIALGTRICFDLKFSASNYWKRVAETKATIAHGIHSMVPMLLNQPVSDFDRQHNARLFYNGTCSEATKFQERFACDIAEAYGATETGMVAFTRGAAHTPMGACGLINTEAFDVLIVDDEDEPIPCGQRGEILVRPRHTHSMMVGYLNRPEATADTYRNLWFHTGDNGSVDKHGYLYFYDRKKDALRRRGENISSYEVERVINAHPCVLESAVVAVPSGLVDDEIKAYVVLKKGTKLPYEQLSVFLANELPDFMVPRYLEYREELPKTPNEKIEKHILRQEGALGASNAAWDKTQH